VVFFSILCIAFSGCARETEFKEPYDVVSKSKEYGITESYEEELEAPGENNFYAEDVAVGGTENTTDEEITEGLAQAVGLFDVGQREILYSRNLYDKLYPASTTKVLTAYVAIKHAKLNKKATVSETALQLDADSSVCGLQVGDQLTLEQLLYGLMLESGNDAANVIAETVSGSIEDFVKLMNQEAKAIGATDSHFANAHGLHDEQHYVTLYDLYLIFNKAISEDFFMKLLSTPNYTVNYTNSAGESITRDWASTNWYMEGTAETPEGITIIGGKTGTTNAAGNCLVLLSRTPKNDPYISIVLKSETKENLYTQMSELLKKALK
jgi:D-alanyl-D-alanine carboxypeptidase (penicillin-binding protein 5/6)